MALHLLELIVGHSSTKLPATNQENGHTHKWTLFVKPANRDYEDFPDNKLIQKVKFQLHESFAQPVRWVTKPPFRITETGFASFSTLVTVYLNLPNEKPRTLPYDLVLFNGDHDFQVTTQKLAIRNDDVPSWYVEQIKRYSKTKKRKASMISSSNDEKSPPSSKQQAKEMMTPVKEEYEKDRSEKIKKGKNKDSSNMNGVKSSPHKLDKRKQNEAPADEKIEKIKSPEELTRRLNMCSDPYVIYKASEFLLTLPDTKLSSSTLKLTFDISKCSSETLAEIERVLKSKKSKTRS